MDPQKPVPRSYSRSWYTVVIALILIPAILCFPLRPLLQSTRLLSADDIAVTFYLCWLGVVVAVSWSAASIKAGLVTWIWLSVLLGIVGMHVPFGDTIVHLGGGPSDDYSGRFCGMGVPVPVVMWDKGRDFPNPLALILNPIFVYLPSAIMFLILRGVLSFFRSLFRRAQEPASPE